MYHCHEAHEFANAAVKNIERFIRESCEQLDGLVLSCKEVQEGKVDNEHKAGSVRKDKEKPPFQGK